MDEKTNGEKLDELMGLVQSLAAFRPQPANVYNRVQHYDGVARAVTRVGIFAAAVSASYLLHNPNYMYLICLCVFTRQKAGPRKTAQEQLSEINARLDHMMNNPPQA